MSGYWEGGFSKNSDGSSAGNSGSSHRHPLATHSACKVQKHAGNGKAQIQKWRHLMWMVLCVRYVLVHDPLWHLLTLDRTQKTGHWNHKGWWLMKIIKIYKWMPPPPNFQTEFLSENKLFPQGVTQVLTSPRWMQTLWKRDSSNILHLVTILGQGYFFSTPTNHQTILFQILFHALGDTWRFYSWFRNQFWNA